MNKSLDASSTAGDAAIEYVFGHAPKGWPNCNAQQRLAAEKIIAYFLYAQHEKISLDLVVNFDKTGNPVGMTHRGFTSFRGTTAEFAPFKEQ